MQVYVSKGGQQYGPYTVGEVRQYVEAGNFAPPTTPAATAPTFGRVSGR